MLNRNEDYFTETCIIKDIYIFVVMIPGDVGVKDEAENQIIEYTRLIKTAEMSSFNAQW